MLKIIQVSEGEMSDTEEIETCKSTGLVKNVNVECVIRAEKEKREKEKEDAQKKKEKDKEDR